MGAMDDVYSMTGSTKDQKHAVYQQWLDGTIAKRPTPTADFVPTLKAVAQLLKQDPIDFSVPGLSRFLSTAEAQRAQIDRGEAATAHQATESTTKPPNPPLLPLPPPRPRSRSR